MAEINTVSLTGRLTHDVELRTTKGGTSVASLRVASATRRKDPTSGEWGEKPNYFSVVVWGRQAENAAQYLGKGRRVGVQGRLEWKEWEAKDGSKRQDVEIVAQDVVFLDPPQAAQERSDAPFDEPVDSDPNPTDIPF